MWRNFSLSMFLFYLTFHYRNGKKTDLQLQRQSLHRKQRFHAKFGDRTPSKCNLTRRMKRSSSTNRLEIFSSVWTQRRDFNSYNTSIQIDRCSTPTSWNIEQVIYEIELPVAYSGMEWVTKPPAATTQRVCRRSTCNRALSGVSKLEPLAFFTGANSSSRTTYLFHRTK